MSLSFTTNLNNYGPFGSTPADADQYFSVSIEDSDIARFHGRCGYYLDALGILCATRLLLMKRWRCSKFGKFDGDDPNDAGVERIIEINGPSDEFLTSISATCEHYKGNMTITSLSFTANITRHGPFGTVSGTSFSSIPAEGCVVTGFHVRGGYYIDAIGIYVKPYH
ncbi:mannose/glucose-specific lectin-like [Prosopis cineraria]|uniref:mannose/glucose-specific lectin-like n=1 Tax=Prosopis cineraria TaxID=364024 RepID=UPI0024102AF2|nr:mannose/glucose-specific lectin-like [Prosopis cineraria]